MDSRPRRYLDLSSITARREKRDPRSKITRIAFVLQNRRVTIPNSMTCDALPATIKSNKGLSLHKL